MNVHETQPEKKGRFEKHPLAMTLLVLFSAAFCVVVYLFATGSVPLGDAIFYWLASALCAMSSAGHAFSEEIDKADPEATPETDTEASAG